MDDIDSIRDLLFQAMDEQLATEKQNNALAQTLGQQKINYNNDARGTLYSGQPTWERSQLAQQGVQNLASLNSNYLKQKLDIWSNLTSVLDQINSYNKAAEAMTKSAQNISSGTSTPSASSSYADIYASLQGGQ